MPTGVFLFVNLSVRFPQIVGHATLPSRICYSIARLFLLFVRISSFSLFSESIRPLNQRNPNLYAIPNCGLVSRESAIEGAANFSSLALRSPATCPLSCHFPRTGVCGQASSASAKRRKRCLRYLCATEHLPRRVARVLCVNSRTTPTSRTANSKTASSRPPTPLLPVQIDAPPGCCPPLGTARVRRRIIY